MRNEIYYEWVLEEVDSDGDVIDLDHSEKLHTRPF